MLQGLAAGLVPGLQGWMGGDGRGWDGMGWDGMGEEGIPAHILPPAPTGAVGNIPNIPNPKPEGRCTLVNIPIISTKLIPKVIWVVLCSSSPTEELTERRVFILLCWHWGHELGS